ncbi:Uncharacterised protein [Yersinia thracica]|uniref:Uncharacterized protein n=1 Tax=Yersinia thracica TaxID=2890319 RepID=A0A0T9NFS6_9GAMM|nr:hypothetical protein [Yersinia thracica]CNH05732.1 Uncharacterised protein [Yersinia thracica]
MSVQENTAQGTATTVLEKIGLTMPRVLGRLAPENLSRAVSDADCG